MSILARRGPEPYQKLLRDLGIYERLHESHQPVHIAADPSHGLRQRVAVAIRAGSRVLGYIWLQEGVEGLAPHVDSVMAGSARHAAAELLRQRTGHPLGGGTDRLQGLLDGGGQMGPRARAAGIDPGQPVALILLSVAAKVESGDPEELVHSDVASIAAVHASAFRQAALVGRVDASVGVLLPDVGSAAAPGGLERLARVMVDDADAHFGYRVQAAIGPVTPNLGATVLAVPLVERLLEVLAADPGQLSASFAQLEAQALVREILRMVGPRTELRHAGLDRLRRDHPELAHTVASYLAHFGDVVRCAEDLAIHRNTVHYRLRRACELSGLDLDDADHRLLAQLQLRLVDG